MTITSSGYIIADNEGVIYGTGATVDEAWLATRETLRCAGIELLSDDEDSDEHVGAWTRESGLRAWPATAALLALIHDQGGHRAWEKIGGVACMIDEA